MRITKSPSFWHAVARIGLIVTCAGLTLMASGMSADAPDNTRLFLTTILLGFATAVGLLSELRRKW